MQVEHREAAGIHYTHVYLEDGEDLVDQTFEEYVIVHGRKLAIVRDCTFRKGVTIDGSGAGVFGCTVFGGAA